MDKCFEARKIPRVSSPPSVYHSHRARKQSPSKVEGTTSIQELCIIINKRGNDGFYKVKDVYLQHILPCPIHLQHNLLSYPKKLHISSHTQ